MKQFNGETATYDLLDVVFNFAQKQEGLRKLLKLETQIA